MVNRPALIYKKTNILRSNNAFENVKHIVVSETTFDAKFGLTLRKKSHFMKHYLAKKLSSSSSLPSSSPSLSSFFSLSFFFFFFLRFFYGGLGVRAPIAAPWLLAWMRTPDVVSWLVLLAAILLNLNWTR